MGDEGWLHYVQDKIIKFGKRPDGIYVPSVIYINVAMNSLRSSRRSGNCGALYVENSTLNSS